MARRNRLVGLIHPFSKTKGAFDWHTVDVGRPGTPGSNKVLATVNVPTEDVDVGLRVGLGNTDERYEPVPRSDAAVEVVMLPGLAVMGEGLSECDQHMVQESKNAGQTSPVMTMSWMPVQTVSINSSGISGYSSYSDSVSASTSMSIGSSHGIPRPSSRC